MAAARHARRPDRASSKIGAMALRAVVEWEAVVAKPGAVERGARALGPAMRVRAFAGGGLARERARNERGRDDGGDEDTPHGGAASQAMFRREIA